MIAEGEDERLPAPARECLGSLARVLAAIDREAALAERCIHVWHRQNQASRNLESIPAIGPIIASALVASVSDPGALRTGRELAAWIGLVPRQNSTGGKARMGRISKQRRPYLRWLLVAGAMAVIRHGRKTGFKDHPWQAWAISWGPIRGSH